MDNTFNGIFLSDQRRIGGQLKTDSNCITWKGDEQSLRYEPSEIQNAFWCKVGSKFQIRFTIEEGNSVCFDGFRRSDYDVLLPYMKQVFKIDVQEEKLSSDGVNWGNTDFEGADGNENIVMKDAEGRRLFELGLSELSQCALPSKNEVEFQFVEEDTTQTTVLPFLSSQQQEESLVNLRFYMPQGTDNDDEVTAAARFQNMILEHAGLSNNSGNMIAEVDDRIGSFVTPRGRYTMEFYDNYMRMNGKTYTYKVLYKTISSIYMFDLPDITHKALVFCLTKPLRQGQQVYPHLVLYVPTDRTTITLNISETVLNEKYGGKLQENMHDEAYKLVAKIFKFIGGVKLYSSGDFRSSRGTTYIRCVHKSEGGLLYFMERTIFFIHKPTLQIAYDDISAAQYRRYDPSSHSGNKMFDINFQLKGQSNTNFVFHNIEYADFQSINAKLSSKDIHQLGIKKQNLANLDTDSDDEDFEQQGSVDAASDDGEYHGDGHGGEESETSDTDEVMKELEEESDIGMDVEDKKDESGMDVEEVATVNDDTPAKRQKLDK